MSLDCRQCLVKLALLVPFLVLKREAPSAILANHFLVDARLVRLVVLRRSLDAYRLRLLVILLVVLLDPLPVSFQILFSDLLLPLLIFLQHGINNCLQVDGHPNIL